MAITIECPRCTHEQKVDDDKVGHEVPCKICHHQIKVGGGVDSKAKLAGAKDLPADAVKAGTPGAVKTKKPPAAAAGKSPKKKSDPDEEVDIKRPTPRRQPEEEEGSAKGLFMIVGGIGVFVVLVFLCGGGGLGAYFLFRSDTKAEEQVAQNDQPKPEGNRPNNPEPGPFDPGPPPFNPPPPPPPFDPPFPPPPPPQENLNPNNPQHIDRVLTILQGPADQRGTAYNWLVAADSNHPRRNQVAQRLERLVDEELRNPFTRFFDAYFRWATRDNIQSLTRFAENNAFTVGDNDRRQRSMVALGKLKEVGAAENIASKLNNAFDGDTAYNALADMGPGAQNVVLKYFNHPDGRVRDRARQLLQGYGTKSDVFFTQCLTDLDNADGNRRGAALQWLAKAPVDDKRKADVSRALNKSLDNPDCLRNGDLVTALDLWGTKENTAKLAKILDESKFGNGAAIKILAKIGDPDALRAVGRSCGNFFNQQEAKNVLKDKGVAGEQVVIEAMFANKDNNARLHFVRLLGDIGTRNVSGNALVRYAQTNQQDRLLASVIQSELRKINDRGK